MARTLAYLVTNAGARPRQGDRAEGFDMGQFWNSHACRGCHAAAFRAGLAANPEAEPHYDALMAGRGTKRKEPE